MSTQGEIERIVWVDVDPRISSCLAWERFRWRVMKMDVNPLTMKKIMNLRNIFFPCTNHCQIPLVRQVIKAVGFSDPVLSALFIAIFNIRSTYVAHQQSPTFLWYFLFGKGAQVRNENKDNNKKKKSFRKCKRWLHLPLRELFVYLRNNYNGETNLDQFWKVKRPNWTHSIV